MDARRFFLPDCSIHLYLHNCTFGSVVYSRGSSTIHNWYYSFIFLCPDCSVIFFSIIFHSLRVVCKLNPGFKFNVLFILLFKTRGLWPLDAATEVLLPRPSDTCWPTKYELLTTAVRKLLTSVPLRWNRCSLERPCQGPPTHRIRTTCNHPLEIGD
jgi:hypothetical protein